MHKMSCKKPTQENTKKNLNITSNKIIRTNQKQRKKQNKQRPEKKTKKNGKTFTS